MGGMDETERVHRIVSKAVGWAQRGIAAESLMRTVLDVLELEGVDDSVKVRASIDLISVLAKERG